MKALISLILTVLAIFYCILPRLIAGENPLLVTTIVSIIITFVATFIIAGINKKAIVEAIKDGTLDIIATDHAPHSEEEKAKAITEAPSGILGLETAFALGVGELVEKNDMPLIDLIERMSYAPAKMYGLDAGYIKQDGPADLIIFDPNEMWRVEGFLSKSQNSPFLGKMMLGKIKKTICNGNVIYSDETIN